MAGSAGASGSGGCAKPCDGECIDGRCLVTLATVVDPQPYAIAVDAKNVYWSEYPGGVMKVPISGGTPTTLATNQGPYPEIAIDGTNIYWTNQEPGSVMKMPISGGTPTVLFSGAFPWDVAVDATSVYWTNRAVTGTAGSVMKVPIDGGTPTTLASGPGDPGPIAVDANSVYWTEYGSDLASQGSNVMKVPIVGGTVVTLAANQKQPSGPAVDASSVFWIADKAVMQAPLAGGTPTRLADAPGANNVVVDGATLYWASDAGWDLTARGGASKVATAGGPATVLLASDRHCVDLAVDATSVYWTEVVDDFPMGEYAGGGAVMKLTPK